MTNRREILQIAAASALPRVAHGAVSDAATSPGPIALHSVLIDERFTAARTVRDRFASRGTVVHSVPEGDITQIWVRHIGPAWAKRPAAVAGLTARPALFCLEQFALACGMRVVFHSEHIVHPAGTTEHVVLRGARAAGVSARELRRAGSLWPVRIADAIAIHRKYSAQERFGRSDSALEPLLPPGAQLLTSWIIAAA